MTSHHHQPKILTGLESSTTIYWVSTCINPGHHSIIYYLGQSVIKWTAEYTRVLHTTVDVLVNTLCELREKLFDACIALPISARAQTIVYFVYSVQRQGYHYGFLLFKKSIGVSFSMAHLSLWFISWAFEKIIHNLWHAAQLSNPYIAAVTESLYTFQCMTVLYRCS